MDIAENLADLDRISHFGYEAALLKSVELCCVLDIAGNQHYPPSWVEAENSLDQVVTGSATPVRASQ